MHKNKMSRFSALFIALVITITLTLRVYLSSLTEGSVLAGISHLSQYFTILSNTLVMLSMLLIALGFKLPRVYLFALVVSILGVGIIYHLLLADLFNFEGLEFLADQSLHTVAPILTLSWWIAFADTQEKKYSDLFYGIIWPLVYSVFALIRANFSGVYPYPFLNLTELGVIGLAKSILGLTIGFIIIGLVLMFLSRLRKHES